MYLQDMLTKWWSFVVLVKLWEGIIKIHGREVAYEPSYYGFSCLFCVFIRFIPSK